MLVGLAFERDMTLYPRRKDERKDKCRDCKRWVEQHSDCIEPCNHAQHTSGHDYRNGEEGSVFQAVK